MTCTRILALCSVAATTVGLACADTYSWVQWTSSTATTVSGTIATSNGPVGVTLQGNYDSLVYNYPNWNYGNTFYDGTTISNAPNPNAIVQLSTVDSYNLTFSQPVDNLAFSVWSVGSGGNSVTYSFDHNLTLDAGGPSQEYGGGSITTTANTLTGAEGNGTVIFNGPLTNLNWSVQEPEYWHGFTLGLQTQQSVPEPMSMLGLAGGVVAMVRRRRGSKAA